MSRGGPLQIVGFDCAVEPQDVGVCRALLDEGRLRVLELHDGMSAREIASLVNRWLHDVPRALIALDAPLGWPAPLAEELAEHRAGDTLSREANELFRRDTDDVIAEALGKRPLEVGADRVARTAHAALELLREIRWSTNLAIPLSWSPGEPAQTEAIEVYPAATLKAHALLANGYHGPVNQGIRRRLVEDLEQHMELPRDIAEAMIRSDHLFDAVVCALAAKDFALEEMIVPKNLESARREGWIWVKRPR